MFVLFMVLFSISVVNTSKFEVLKKSLQDAFNSGLTGGRDERAGGRRQRQRQPGRGHPVQPDRAGAALRGRHQPLRGLARAAARDQAADERREGHRPDRREGRPLQERQRRGQRARPDAAHRDRRRPLRLRPRRAAPRGHAHHRPDRRLAGQAAQPDPGRGAHRQPAHRLRPVPLELGALRRPRGGRGRRSCRTPASRRRGFRPRASAPPARSPPTRARPAAARTAASRSSSCASRARPNSHQRPPSVDKEPT